MKRGRYRRHESEVDAGALTDIMFFLLFFFLILSTMTNPNLIKLFLPESAQSSDIEKGFATVSIDKELKFYVDSKEVTEENLSESIAQEVKKKGNDVLVLQVDKDVPVQNLVTVLSIGMQQKLKVTLETERKH